MKILIAFQIFTIIAAGEALQCMKCKAINAEDCTGESVECQNCGDVCAKGMEYNRVDGDLIITVYRGCLSRTELCNYEMNLSTTRFELSAYHECCRGDNCNCGPIQKPARNNTKTGLICNSCFLEGCTTCPQSQHEPVECIGNERECYKYYGKISRPGREIKDYYSAGCGTPGTCSRMKDALVGAKLYQPYHLSCTKAFEKRDCYTVQE